MPSRGRHRDKERSFDLSADYDKDHKKHRLECHLDHSECYPVVMVEKPVDHVSRDQRHSHTKFGLVDERGAQRYCDKSEKIRKLGIKF